MKTSHILITPQFEHFHPNNEHKFTTREGAPVRLYSAGAGGDFPIHGAYLVDGNWFPASWTTTGLYHDGETVSRLDIIEAPKKFKFERWYNIYKWDTGDGFLTSSYNTEAEANRSADPERIACVKQIFEGTES